MTRVIIRLQRAVIFLAALLCLFPTNRAAGCESDGRLAMGTVLEVTLCDQNTAASQQVLDVLFATVMRLDALFSTFSPDSTISVLNAQAGQGMLATPPEVSALLGLSKRYWTLTAGTFDVTIGPLMAVWSDAGRTQTLPSRTVLTKVHAHIGSNKIHLSPQNRVRLEQTGMAIDLGGVAKGYALDQIVRGLKERGIENALLDFGQSSIWALGAPPDAPRWRLLIQRPDGKNVGVVTLRDQALSVSASFGQSFTIQGRQYGHIIDPRNGMPLTRDLLACVIAPDATQAEALSKALLILGEHKGIALLERLPGVEGFLHDVQGNQWMTSGWKQATSFVTNPANQE